MVSDNGRKSLFRLLWVAATLLCVVVSSDVLEPAWAQDQGDGIRRNVLCRAKIRGRDTLYLASLAEVQVFGKKRFKTKAQQARWTKYIYNVKRALPFARKIANEYRIILREMAPLQTEEEKIAYIDQKEKELFAKYEKDLKHLTIKQGRILIKLIDRETDSSAYQIIKLLKGDFKAFWWQGFAALFGSSLKVEYDPDGLDKYLENVVMLIDMGYY